MRRTDAECKSYVFLFVISADMRNFALLFNQIQSIFSTIWLDI